MRRPRPNRCGGGRARECPIRASLWSLNNEAGGPEVTAVCAELAGLLIDDLDGLRAAVGPQVARQPVYASLHPEEASEVARTTRVVAQTLTECMAQGRGLRATEAQAMALLGRRRADLGIPLTSVVEAIMSGALAGHELLEGHATSWADPPLAIRAFGRMSRDLFGAVHEATSLVTAGYRDEEQERVTHLIREQASFVEDVFGGAWPSGAEVIERGHALGFPLTERCLLVIVLPETERDTPRLEDAMARFVRCFEDSAISGPMRSGSVGHGVVLLPLSDEELAELSTVAARADRAAIDARVIALAQVIDDLGNVAVGYAALRDDAGLARAAFRSPRLVMVGDLHEYRVLREASPGDAFAFIRSVLGPLLARPPSDAAQLIETLEVVVSSDTSVEALAAQMNISYSGLRYRIRRITKITGTAPNDRTVRFRMQLALRLFRVHERRLPALGDKQWEPDTPLGRCEPAAD